MFILRQVLLGTLLLYLYHTNLMCDSEQTYFIKSTEDTPCAAQPCLTLSKFVNNITNDVKIGVILQFGAGNHTLNSQWNFSNNDKCSMSSKGRNSTIICDKLGAGIAFSNVSMVTLTNLTFIGCGNNSRFYAVLQLFLEVPSMPLAPYLQWVVTGINTGEINV